MRPRIPRLVPLAVLALCFAASVTKGERDGEIVRELPWILPGLPGGERTLLVLGGSHELPRPIAGARVLVYREEIRSHVVRARLVGKAEADEFGIAALPPLPEGILQFVALAPGFAPGYEVTLDGRAPESIVLPPGRDRRFRVFDPLGEPLPGARVSLFLGCPHSPSVREATTGPDGIVSLPEVTGDGQLFVVGEGVRPGPYSLPIHVVGRPEATLVTRPGPTARGAVLRRDGSPAAGIVVRDTSGFPRGPVAVTDERGEFSLHGVVSGEARLLFFDPASAEPHRPAAAERFDSRLPLRVTLGEPSGGGEPRVRVEVDLVPDSAFEPEGVPVVLTRLEDGLSIRSRTGRHLYDAGGTGSCPAFLDVPPGRYRLRVGGGFSGVAEATAEIEVPAAGIRRIPVGVRETPRLDCDALVDAGISEATLVLAGEERDFRARRYGGPLLPAAGPAAIRVPCGPGEILLSVGPAEASGRTVRGGLPLPPPTVVRVRVTDGEGTPLDPPFTATPYGDEWEVEGDGTWQLSTYLAGPQRLDFSAGAAHLKRTVDLPSEPGRTLELPPVVLPAAEPVVLDARGRSVGDASIEVDGADRSYVHVPSRREDVAWLPLALPPGEAPPPEVRLPGGVVRVRVRDAAGEPLRFALLLDGHRFESGTGDLTIRGVPSGPHVLLTGTPHRPAVVRRILLAEGEDREVEVVVGPR